MKLTEKRIIEIKDRILKIDYILSESWQNTSYDNSFVELEEEQAKLEDELNKLESDIRSEKIDKAWELVNSKHIETNEEIQLVRFAVKTARELVERDTPMKVIKEVDKKYLKIIESQGGFERFGS